MAKRFAAERQAERPIGTLASPHKAQPGAPPPHSPPVPALQVRPPPHSSHSSHAGHRDSARAPPPHSLFGQQQPGRDGLSANAPPPGTDQRARARAALFGPPTPEGGPGPGYSHGHGHGHSRGGGGGGGVESVFPPPPAHAHAAQGQGQGHDRRDRGIFSANGSVAGPRRGTTTQPPTQPATPQPRVAQNAGHVFPREPEPAPAPRTFAEAAGDPHAHLRHSPVTTAVPGAGNMPLAPPHGGGGGLQEELSRLRYEKQVRVVCSVLVLCVCVCVCVCCVLCAVCCVLPPCGCGLAVWCLLVQCGCVSTG